MTNDFGCLGGTLGLRLDCLIWAFLRAVEGASIFVIPNASQNVPISHRDWARSLPYLDWIFISLPRERPSVLTIPKS